MYKFRFFLFIVCLGARCIADVPAGADRICGKWLSGEKNLMVEVYKADNQFKAKIIWYKDDPKYAMDEWRDKHNPDPKLRSRKILGMDVLHGLVYDAHNDTWEHGIIYDAQHGKEWDAWCCIDKEGLLKVKGYWCFKFIGRTMTFRRVNP